MTEAADDADGLSEFRAFTPRRGPECSVCRALKTMTEDHRDKCRRAIAADDISDVAVVGWLADKGYSLGVENPKAAVANHRQNGHRGG